MPITGGPGRAGKPRSKIIGEDRLGEFQRLLHNQSQKAVYNYIVGNFDGQDRNEISPDAPDMSAVRYHLALAVGSESSAPSDDFFEVNFLFFKRQNSAYLRKLREMEEAAAVNVAEGK